MKKHNKKAELINKMEKELQELKEGSKATEYIDSLRAKLKKVPNWKHQAMMAQMDSDFEQFISSHDRLAIKMN